MHPDLGSKAELKSCNFSGNGLEELLLNILSDLEDICGTSYKQYTSMLSKFSDPEPEQDTCKAMPAEPVSRYVGGSVGDKVGSIFSHIRDIKTYQNRLQGQIEKI